MSIIVQQSIVNDAVQADGRRMVTYQYTDHTGRQHVVGPMLVMADYDTTYGMNEKCTELESNLVSNELREMIERVESGLLDDRAKAGENVLAINTVYASPQEVRAALFVWFQSSDALQARHLVPGIDALTDTDLASMLSIDAAHIAAIRARADRLRQINTLVQMDG